MSPGRRARSVLLTALSLGLVATVPVAGGQARAQLLVTVLDADGQAAPFAPTH